MTKNYKLPGSSDLKLVQLLRKDDHDAFEKLFERYAQKLFVFSLAYLKESYLAEEIVQEVFLKVWTNRHSLKTETSIQSYLFTIAFNSIRKSFNKKAKENLYKSELIDQLDEELDRVDFENNYQLAFKKLGIFINEMPEKRKQIFVRRKQIGEPVRQIAKELGVSVKTVENQITEAMKYLKRRFEEEFPGGLLFLTIFSAKPNYREQLT